MRYQVKEIGALDIRLFVISGMMVLLVGLMIVIFTKGELGYKGNNQCDSAKDTV
jgi:hypothetical protein